MGKAKPDIDVEKIAEEVTAKIRNQPKPEKKSVALLKKQLRSKNNTNTKKLGTPKVTKLCPGIRFLLSWDPSNLDKFHSYLIKCRNFTITMEGEFKKLGYETHKIVFRFRVNIVEDPTVKHDFSNRICILLLFTNATCRKTLLQGTFTKRIGKIFRGRTDQCYAISLAQIKYSVFNTKDHMRYSEKLSDCLEWSKSGTVFNHRSDFVLTSQRIYGGKMQVLCRIDLSHLKRDTKRLELGVDNFVAECLIKVIESESSQNVEENAE